MSSFALASATWLENALEDAYPGTLDNLPNIQAGEIHRGSCSEGVRRAFAILEEMQRQVPQVSKNGRQLFNAHRELVAVHIRAELLELFPVTYRWRLGVRKNGGVIAHVVGQGKLEMPEYVRGVFP